jgi:hypothetical protein
MSYLKINHKPTATSNFDSGKLVLSRLAIGALSFEGSIMIVAVAVQHVALIEWTAFTPSPISWCNAMENLVVI